MTDAETRITELTAERNALARAVDVLNRQLLAFEHEHGALKPEALDAPLNPALDRYFWLRGPPLEDDIIVFFLPRGEK